MENDKLNKLKADAEAKGYRVLVDCDGIMADKIVQTKDGPTKITTSKFYFDRLADIAAEFASAISDALKIESEISLGDIDQSDLDDPGVPA